MRKHLWIGVAAGFIASSVAADIYRWTDESGGRHYSDRRTEKAEVVAFHPGYTFYRVKTVFDGDTILLENGRKVRLLGINTPEVEGRNKTAEPGGQKAKKWLTENIGGQTVRLEPDVEKTDKYGRLLAHVFTKSGRFLNLELVENGLATTNIFPPNLRYVEQLLRAEASAEKGGLGLWSEPYYESRPYSSVRDSRGWKRVRGTVGRLKQTAKYAYLYFSDRFSLRISRSDQSLFPDLQSYRGKAVEARGWLSKQRDGYSMRLRHPGQLKFTEQ